MLKCYEISFVLRRKRTPYTIFVDILDVLSGNSKTPNVQYDKLHFIKDCKPGESLNDGDINHCVAYWNERRENRFWRISPSTVSFKEIKSGDFNKGLMVYEREQVDCYAKLYHMYRVMVDN